MGGNNKPPGITDGGDITRTNGGKPSGWQVGETLKQVNNIVGNQCNCGYCGICNERKKNQKNKPK